MWTPIDELILPLNYGCAKLARLKKSDRPNNKKIARIAI